MLKHPGRFQGQQTAWDVGKDTIDNLGSMYVL